MTFSRSHATELSKDVEIEVKDFEARDTDAITASTMNTGVDEARREEIRVFLKERFGQYHADAKEGTQVRRVNSLLRVSTCSECEGIVTRCGIIYLLIIERLTVVGV